MSQTVTHFEDLPDDLQEILKEEGISSFSTLQEEAVSAILSGKDIWIKGPAASGKTYAYLLPALSLLEPQGKGKHYPLILILLPTRELAVQTARIARRLLRRREGFRTALLTGGEDMNRQVRAFSKGADIVIATPARLNDHIRRHTFRPKMLKMVVIDEADLMLGMGFEEDVIKAVNALPDVQKVLLSATVNRQAQQQFEALLHDPVSVNVKEEKIHAQQITYTYQTVRNNEKLDRLAQLVKEAEQPPIIFCNKRVTAAFVSEQLNRRGIHSAAVHSEMDRKERMRIMDAFRQTKLDALCATDVLARGIDIPFVSLVILYDLPDDPDTLIHRTARSSRKAQASAAVFLITEKERKRLFGLQEVLGAKISKL